MGFAADYDGLNEDSPGDVFYGHQSAHQQLCDTKSHRQCERSRYDCDSYLKVCYLLLCPFHLLLLLHLTSSVNGVAMTVTAVITLKVLPLWVIK